VRGQFKGYRDEAGVAKNSQIETFAALQLHIDTWRWADVHSISAPGNPTHQRHGVTVTLKRPRCPSSIPMKPCRETISACA